MIKGTHHSEETLLKMSLALMGQTNMLGKHHSEETKLKMKLVRRGNPNCSGYHHTDEAKLKISLNNGNKDGRTWLGKHPSDESKLKMSLAQRGEKGNNWQGGISPMNKRLRRNAEYRKWRKEVFKRDNYICQMCGKIGIYLHPHHIKLFSEYPELRFEIDNGVTLCITCHLTTGLHKKELSA